MSVANIAKLQHIHVRVVTYNNKN